MHPVGTKPRAILLGSGGFVAEWTLTRDEPTMELLVPRRVPFSVNIEEYPQPILRQSHRVFRLDLTKRDGTRRWWRVYNEGRSQTPEDGFVYIELTDPPPPTGTAHE